MESSEGDRLREFCGLPGSRCDGEGPSQYEGHCNYVADSCNTCVLVGEMRMRLR